MRLLRIGLPLVAVALVSAALIPFQVMAIAAGSRLSEKIPLLYHGLITRILRITVRVHGERAGARPILYVCNHVSWLDITVLARVLPASFISKTEVADWPFFGMLAKLQRSVFINRTRANSRDHGDEMQRRLEQGDNLILFPEGTSSDGIRLLPFKSTFFVLAERHIAGKPLTVQPVSLAYTRRNGMALARNLLPDVAWYGDMDLVPHLLGILRGGPITAEIMLHEPVNIDEFASRKEMAAYCHARIANGVSDLMRQRPVESRPAADIVAVTTGNGGFAAGGAAES